MDNRFIFLLVGELLLQEVEGEDGGDHETERDDRIEDSKAALQARIVRVVDNEALVRLEVHVEQLLERYGQQDAADWNGDNVQRRILQLVVEVALERERHAGHADGDRQVHD